jgi:hypothetical protein
MKARTRYSDLLDAIRELDAAERASTIACDARSALPPGTSRARVTTANANWARKAEHRDRLQDRAEAEILRAFSHLAPYDHWARWWAIAAQPSETDAEAAEKAYCAAVLKEQGKFA